MRRLALLGACLVVLLPGRYAGAFSDDKAEPDLHPKPIDPVASKDLEDAVRRGVAFLLSDQNKNGSWGSPTRTKNLNIYTPVPDGHDALICGATSLCVA